MPLDGFADKVRQVAFAGQTPPFTKERAVSGDCGDKSLIQNLPDSKPQGKYLNRRSNSYFKDANSPSWNESPSQGLSGQSISNNEVSKDGEEENGTRHRGFSDISAEEVKLPVAKFTKERSKSKNDVYDGASPMTSPL